MLIAQKEVSSYQTVTDASSISMKRSTIKRQKGSVVVVNSPVTYSSWITTKYSICSRALRKGKICALVLGCCYSGPYVLLRSTTYKEPFVTYYVGHVVNWICALAAWTVCCCLHCDVNRILKLHQNLRLSNSHLLFILNRANIKNASILNYIYLPNMLMECLVIDRFKNSLWIGCNKRGSRDFGWSVFGDLEKLSKFQKWKGGKVTIEVSPSKVCQVFVPNVVTNVCIHSKHT